MFCDIDKDVDQLTEEEWPFSLSTAIFRLTSAMAATKFDPCIVYRPTNIWKAEVHISILHGFGLLCGLCKHSVGAAEPALAVTEILYLAPPGVELNRRPKSRNPLTQIFAFSFALTCASIGRLIELKIICSDL